MKPAGPSADLLFFLEKETVSAVLDTGVESYLLTGSDTGDFTKAITSVSNGIKYFSVEVKKFAHEYFRNK